jgi:uncharacterized protein involved in exopolysaccharide biosynthesis
MAQPAALQQAGGASTAPAFKPQIVRSVRMHPRLAIGVAATVCLLLAGYGLTRKPVYTAESQVYEEPAASKLMSDGTSGAFDPSRYDSYLQQQMLMVERPDVLAAALAALPPATWHELGPNEHAAVASLAAQLKVARVTTSYQLSISLQSSDPVGAAAIVNAVTSAYLDAVHKETSAQTDQRAQLLAEERQRIESELQTTRQEQAGLSASLGVASPLGETSNPYDFEIASVRQQLLIAREAHDASAAQLASLSGDGAARNSALGAAADEIIGGDTGLSSMRASVAARRATLNGQMAGMKPDNPVYKQDLDELTDLDKTLDTMTTQLRGKAERQLQAKLRADLERTADVESRLNAQLARLTATATTAAPKLQRASELAADLQRLNTRYAAVDDALRSLQFEANGPGIVRLSLAAAVPTSPEPGRKMSLLLAAPFLGLLFGIGAAVLARKRDHRIYRGRDIEDLLGFAPIAILPARADVSSRVMDEYVLRLAAGIEGAYRNSGAQTFLLTAVSASTDIRPLRNALTAKLERIGLDVAVARTTDLMVAGPEVTEDSRHELAKAADAVGEGFVSVHLAKLKAAHALVVIDAPALGTSAETEYVAHCADASILIAESGVTTREELLHSAKLLERLQARGVGTVLQELELRLADASFRSAIEAFEQRQTDRAYLSEQRDTPYPQASQREDIPAATVMPVIKSEPELEPVAASSKEYVVGEPVEIAEEPRAPEEPAAPEIFQHRSVRVASIVTRIAPLPPPVPVARSNDSLELAMSSRTGSSREKIAPKLSALRKQAVGDTPMSGTKSWFHRFLRRDEEKVSIIPDKDEDGQAVDEAAFLESRISRNVQAYDLPLHDEEAASTEEAQTAAESGAESFSRRFTRQEPHIENGPSEDESPYEDHASAEADAIEHVEEPQPVYVAPADSSDRFVVPKEIIAPWEIRTPQPHAVTGLEVEYPHEPEPERVERVRPARPLSFHELAATFQNQMEHVDIEEPLAPEVKAPAIHLVEEPAPGRAASFAEPVEESREIQVAEVVEAPEPVIQEPGVAREVEEPVVVPEREPAAPVAKVEEVVAPVRDPYAAPPRDLYSLPSGTSRWDPIPPLRPSDSGWNGMQGAAPVPDRHARQTEDWNWTSRGNEAREETTNQHRQDDTPGEELDEPALSRPWGLLSRFQQANLIAPARRQAAQNNRDGAEQGNEAARPGSFEPGRKG